MPSRHPVTRFPTPLCSDPLLAVTKLSETLPYNVDGSNATYFNTRKYTGNIRSFLQATR